MRWPLAGSEYSKYQPPCTTLPFTVTVVSLTKFAALVIFWSKSAMIGIPTPTVDPSGKPVTCTLVTGSTFLAGDGGAVGLTAAVALPLCLATCGWPLVVGWALQAPKTSARAAAALAARPAE